MMPKKNPNATRVWNQGVWTPWLTTEIEWLKSNWSLYAYVKDLSEHLPRHTVAAIKKQAGKLGLPKHDNPHNRSVTPLLVWWEVQSAPGTCQEIADRLNLTRSCVQEVIALFRKAGVVRTSKWAKRHYTWAAVWTAEDTLGAGKPKANGRRRDQIKALQRSGTINPFNLGVRHADAECEEDVCS